MNAKVSSLFAGLLFGVGLAVSGMTLPEKVIAFLDIFGEWDPSLAFVMGGALLTYALGFRWISGWEKPLFDVQFHLPTATTIDRRLLIGAGIFGVGWGIGGFCPGPALTAVGSLSYSAVVFVAAMFVGMGLQHALARRSEQVLPESGGAE